MRVAEYHTKRGYVAKLSTGICWECLGGAYLGTLKIPGQAAFGWAWRADGRSIDPHDPAFDLIDFGAEHHAGAA